MAGFRGFRGFPGFPGFRGFRGFPGFRGSRTLFSVPQKGLENEALESDFGLQNGAKNDAKSEKDDRKAISASDFVFSTVFVRLGSRKWKPRTPLTPLRLLVLLYQNENPFLLTRSGFRDDFGTLLAPFWLHFGRNMGAHAGKIVPETVSKKRLFFNTISCRFGSHFGSILDEAFRPENLPKPGSSPEWILLAPRRSFLLP